MLNQLPSLLSLIVIYSLLFGIGEPVFREANAQGRSMNGPVEGHATTASTHAQALMEPVRVFLPLVTAGAFTQVVIISRDQQTAPVGTVVAQSPTVRVVKDGVPVSNARIDFVVTGGSGQVTGSQQHTDAAGRASAGSWTLGTVAGVNTLDVMFAGQRVLTFIATATAGPAATIQKVTGDGGTTNGGSTRVLEARVVDVHGNAVAGYTVAWAVTSGGGLVSAASSTTNAQGVAAVTWTLSTTPGLHSVTAAASGLQNSPVTFSVSVAADGVSLTTSTVSATPTSLTADGTSTATIRVQLKDASGTNVTKSSGIVTLTTTAGTLGTVTDHQDGSYTATLTAPTIVSAATIRAALAGSSLTQTTTVNFSAGAAAAIVNVSGDGGSAPVGSQRELQVKVVDAFGNPVAGHAIQWTVAGGGSLSAATSTSDAAGLATVGWTLGTKAGTQSVSAAATGLTGSPQTFTVVAQAGAATQLAITTQPSSSVKSGVPFTQQPVIQLRDVYDNGVAQAGVGVTATIASGGGSLGGTKTVMTDEHGVAAFTDLSITGTIGNRTMSFSVPSLTVATSNTITVTAGAASHLMIATQPASTAQSGIVFTQQPVVQVQDASGNPVDQSGITVTAALSTGGGTLGGTTQVTTNAFGIAAFTNLVLSGTVGDRTLAFAATGLSGATSGTITLTSGTPAQLIITTQPASSVQAGVVFGRQPVIQVQDASGNPVTEAGRTITATIASGGETLGGILTASTDANGTATFTTLSIGGTTGNRTLAFTSNGVTGATSNVIVVTAGSAVALAFSAQPTTVIANAPITPAVQVSVLDAYGNLVTSATDSVTVSIGTNAAGSTLAGTATTAAVGGVASFANLSLNKAGTGYRLAASSGALASATSTAFNVVIGPLDHFLVEKFGGGDIENQLVGAPFNVRGTARDAYNNTVTSFVGTVSFTSTPAGGVSAGSTSVAFTGGLLSSHSITFGTSGTFSLTATNASQSGTSNEFQVQAPPAAQADGPATNSSPGQPYHATFSTAANRQTFTLAAPGTLSNDNLGFPVASITSFGGNSLGGSVTTNVAGSMVAPLPSYTSGSLSVSGNGAITFTPPDGFTGNYVFQYRLTNARDVSDATVTIAVGARPVAVNDTYAPVLVGNVAINTATSTQFRLATNDAGDAKTLNIVGQSNGTATLNPDSTFAFHPTAGYEGTASFTYTVSNGFGTSAPATVSMTVATPVWFVQAGAALGGSGRYDAPINSLSTLASINNGADNNPAANDRIFLYSGTYAGPLTLLSGQRLIGQGATASLSSIAGVTWPADAGPEPAMNGTAPTLTGTNGTALTLANIASVTTPNNMLRGFNIGNVGTTGTALGGTSFGTLTMTEVGINTNGQALNLNTGRLSGNFMQVQSTGGTNNVSLANVTTSSTVVLGTSADALSGATGDALIINGGNGSFTYAGSITNITSLAVNITNKSGGSVTIGGDINPVAAGRGIAVTNNATGTNTITFSGAAQKISSGTLPGVNLTNNTDATINFTSGGLAITTTTGNGFNATSSGTVQVSGSANTISSAGGIALNVQNTIISATGLTFRSISANGGPNGIVLNNTGINNGLHVTGDGSTADSGGSIINTTGSDGTTAGTGIYLNNTRSVSVNWMQLSGHANYAIRGNTVNGFTMYKTKITGTNGTSGSGDGEGGVYFYGLSGSASITHSEVEGGIVRNVAVVNTSGTLDRLVMTNNIIGYDGVYGSDGIFLQADNSANTSNAVTFKATVNNNRFLGSAGDQIQMSVRGTSVTDFVFTGNTLTNTNPNRLATNFGVAVSGGGDQATFNPTLTYTISNNSIRDAGSTAISVGKGGIGAGNFTGTISGNTIGVAGVVNSGSVQGSAIVVDLVGGGSHTSTITNNTIRQFTNYGILAQSGNNTAGGGQGYLTVTIQGNNIAEPSPNSAAALFPTSGIRVMQGTNSGDNSKNCVVLGGGLAHEKNTVTGTGTNGGMDLRLFQRFVTLLGVPGYVGANSDNTAMNAFLTSRNTLATINATNNTSSGGPGYSGTCPI